MLPKKLHVNQNKYVNVTLAISARPKEGTREVERFLLVRA